MIDFHTHILPYMDDGSASVEESLKMLAELKRQKVTKVVASSHYYVTERSPNRFLDKRFWALEQLEDALPRNSVQIYLGAEVLYYPGISRMQALPELCVEGTDLLLLEMPFGDWTEYMVREVEELACSGSFTVLLAHIERYLSRHNAPFWDQLLSDGVLMQSNADFFLSFRTRRKALRMLEDGRIHVLGSDCHNMSSRPPHMAEAARTIRERLDSNVLKEIDAFGTSLLPD